MEWISGNIFIRPNRLEKKGDCVNGHKHNFDHTTIVFKGSIHIHAVLPNGTTIDRDFGDGHDVRHCLIKAEVEHQITALEDHTEFWCVYSHRTPQGEVSLVQTGWNEAYV